MKKILCYFMILCLMFSEFANISYALDPSFSISGIILTKNFNGIDPNPFEYTLILQGNKLEGTEVIYLDDTGKVFKVENVEYEDDYLIQYSLGSDFAADEIFVVNDTYRLKVKLSSLLSDMPTLNNLTPKKVNQYTPASVGDEGKIFVDIANYDIFKTDNKFSMISFGTDIKNQVIDGDNKWFKATGEPGFHNVEFQKEIADVDDGEATNIPGNQPIKIRYNYKNTYKIITEITMSDNVSVFPNRGAIGSTVTFKAQDLPNKLDASVFFVKKIGDPYKQQDKGLNAYYEKDSDTFGNDIFTVEVPSSLVPGEEYYMVFTNFVPDGQNPEDVILRETVVDKKFFVISEGSGTSILDFSPKSGSDIGSEVEILGKYFLTLNIDKLLVDEGQVGFPKISIDSNTDTISIEYGSGTLKGQIVNNIKKEVTFYFNNTEEILSKSADLSLFNKDSDKVYIKTKEFLLGEPFKDVVIQARTKTTFNEGGGQLVEYSEYAEKGNYRFISSTVKPEIDKVNPPMVMVKNIGGNYQVIEDTKINILGNNFIVHNFIESTGGTNQEYTVYPKIEIADTLFDKKEGQISNPNQNINEIEMKIFNDRGEEINGTAGNEVGNRIELILPSGLIVPSVLVSIGSSKPDVPVKVINPKRNSLADGLYEETTMKYVVVSDSEVPVVTEINPRKVNVDGSEDISVIGANFKPDIIAFVQGEEVPVNRIDSEHLEINIPEGIIGQALLQILNEDGGLVSLYFDYIDPYTRPDIKSIIPNEGEEGTLSVITADRIFKPDPRGSMLTPLGRSLLLGTRVFLGNIEVSKYRAGIDIINDTNPIPIYNSYEPLIKIKNDELQVAEDYEGILLQKYSKSNPAGVTYDIAEDKFMTIYKDISGEWYISDGNAEVYRITKDTQNRINFSNSNNTLIAKFETGLNSSDYSQVIYGPEGNENMYCLKLATMYETEQKNINLAGIVYAKEDITGHMAIVKYNKDEREIYMHVPPMPSGGLYDVRLINPDNDMAVEKDGFKYWNVEGDSPVISEIEPNFGSVDGGYYVTIKGNNFEKNSLNQSKVIIANKEVLEENIQISADRTEIIFEMPKYDKDLKETYGIDRIEVPVIVSNSKGKSAFVEKGFTLIQAEDKPIVEKIIKDTGSPMGGEEVRILGVDFKLREFGTDINGNGTKNDDYAGVDFSKIEQIHPTWSKDQISKYKEDAFKLLPQIFFGDVKVQIENISQYTESEIRLKTPKHTKGNVPVYVINYDSAISNKDVIYKYEASNVQIDDFMPKQGDKIGGKLIEIKGSEMKQGEIHLFRDDFWQDIIMPIVKFGSISNISKETSGLLTNSLATVDFENDSEFENENFRNNGLSVTYNANSNANTLTIRLKEADKIFEKVIPNYFGEDAYVDLRDVVADEFKEVLYDLIHVKLIEVDTGYRLLVERGFAPKGEYYNESSVSVYTPMYFTIGEEDIVYFNPDGEKGISNSKFNYINPPIKPIIEDVIDIEKLPAYTEEKGNYFKVGPIGTVGRNFTILGSGFVEGLKVQIGGVDVESFEIINENKIKVKAAEKPAGIEFNEELLITIEGEGIDSATSADDNLRESGKGPIYFIYREGTTDTPPVITGVDPIRIKINKEERLKIYGNFFRAENGSVRVRIDGEIVPVISVSVTEIEVQAPVRELPGLVNIYIENRDVLGRTAGVVENETLFGYASDPIIDKLYPEEVSILGGDTVIIEGSGFIDDAIVLIGGVEAEVLSLEENKIKINTPVHTLGIKDVEIRNYDYVENTDFGRFIFEKSITYVVPRPDLPDYFEAIPGHMSSVTLKWSNVDNALRYKLYIKEKNEIEYKYLDEVSSLAYIVKNLEPDSWYQFGLKPVTQFGDSEGMIYATCKTLSATEDLEEKLIDADEVIVTREWMESDKLMIQLADNYSMSNYNINIVGKKNDNVEILIPMKAIMNKKGTANIEANDWLIEINMFGLSRSFPNHINAKKDEFVKINIESKTSRDKKRIENLTKNKLTSNIYLINGKYSYNRTEKIYDINNGVLFGVFLPNRDRFLLSYFNENDLILEQVQTTVKNKFRPSKGEIEYLYEAPLVSSGIYGLSK